MESTGKLAQEHLDCARKKVKSFSESLSKRGASISDSTKVFFQNIENNYERGEKYYNNNRRVRMLYNAASFGGGFLTYVINSWESRKKADEMDEYKKEVHQRISSWVEVCARLGYEVEGVKNGVTNVDNKLSNEITKLDTKINDERDKIEKGLTEKLDKKLGLELNKLRDAVLVKPKSRLFLVVPGLGDVRNESQFQKALESRNRQFGLIH